jgi:hypothetical protein
MIMEMDAYAPVWTPTVNGVMNHLGYSLDDRFKNAGCLILYWFVTNLLVYMYLVWTRDNYQLWKDILKFPANCVKGCIECCRIASGQGGNNVEMRSVSVFHSTNPLQNDGQPHQEQKQKFRPLSFFV